MAQAIEKAFDAQDQGVNIEYLNRASPTDLAPDDPSLLSVFPLDDPIRPFNWSQPKRAFTIFLAFLGTFSVLVNGTAITVAAPEINAQFNISDAHFPHSYWPTAAWTLGAALFQLICLPLMEDLGVKRGYMVCRPLSVHS